MKRGRAHLSVVVEEPRQRDLSLFPKFVASEMLQHSKCPEKMPKQFDVVWNRLMDARANGPLAPVDQWGCERLFQADAPASAQRYQKMLSLLLSPQSKDEKTKESMDNLMAAVAPAKLTPEALLAIPSERLEELIRPSGLYRAKARALRESSESIIRDHNGDVPKTLAELLKFRGVGPKIALLALSACWEIDEGIGCDVHVTRISQRLGWAPGGSAAKNDAETVRKALEEWLPKPLFRPINYSLVGFGQTICTAKSPKCSECPLSTWCPSTTVKRAKE